MKAAPPNNKIGSVFARDDMEAIGPTADLVVRSAVLFECRLDRGLVTVLLWFVSLALPWYAHQQTG